MTEESTPPPAQHPMQRSPTTRDLFKVLFRRKQYIFISFFACLASFFIAVFSNIPKYRATSKLLISAEKQVDSDLYRDIGFVAQIQPAKTPAEILLSEPVLEPVVKALRLHERPADYQLEYAPPLKKVQIQLFRFLSKLLPAPEKKTVEKSLRSPYQSAIYRLKGAISATPVPGSRIVNVAVTDISPENAALLANAVVRSYVIYDIKQQLATLYEKYGEKYPIVRPLKDHIKLLTNNLGTKRLSDTDAIGPASVKIIEQASIPLVPSQPSKVILLFFTLITGGAVSLAIGFAVEYLDQTIKSPDDAETLLSVPVLGVLYGSQKISTDKRQRSHENVAHQIHLMLKPHSGNCIVFAGASHGDDTEATVIACSVALAKSLNVKTLLIDANLRSVPGSPLLQSSGSAGLTSLVKGSCTLEESIVRIDHQFWVLPRGPLEGIHPSFLFHTDILTDYFKRISEEFDMVFINTPPVTNYSDAIALSLIAGRIVLVATERHTRRQVLLKSFNLLRNVNAPLLGTVIAGHHDIVPSLLYERL